jgi:hypothetical protein
MMKGITDLRPVGDCNRVSSQVPINISSIPTCNGDFSARAADIDASQDIATLAISSHLGKCYIRRPIVCMDLQKSFALLCGVKTSEYASKSRFVPKGVHRRTMGPREVQKFWGIPSFLSLI